MSERQRADGTGRGDRPGTAHFRGAIALDGPSGTGKSSVGRAVAARLDAGYLDTGAMYRAATVAVLDAGVDPTDAEGVAATVATASIEVGTNSRREIVRVDGADVAERIRGAEVTSAVSAVSAVPAVRRQLVAQQRALVAEVDAVVVEGRDIGTVVLPDASLKIYLTAAPEVRAQRRASQLRLTTDAEIAALAVELRRRDDYDSARADSPLRPAVDAVVLDSTDLDRAAVVDRVLALVAASTTVGERT